MMHLLRHDLVHDLVRKGCCLTSKSFVDMDLKDLVSQRDLGSMFPAYNGSIKLVDILPRLLTRGHDVDFLVIERTFVPNL